MTVYKIPFPHVEIRSDGIVKIDLDKIPFPEALSPFHQFIFLLPPGHVGGNHRHLRRELFLSLENHLEIHWIDSYGIIRKEKMKDDNHFYLFDVQPNVPHAIVNTSKMEPAALFEFATKDSFQPEPYRVFSKNECESVR